MRTVPLSALLVPLALLLPAGADECVPSTSVSDERQTVVDVPTPGVWPHHTYVAVDHCGACLSTWIYVESNGMDGLQRGDEVRDDTCGGEIAPDGLHGL